MSKGEYIRPLCLYENTCLDKKQKTRDCKTCVHHTDYWAEVTQKELTEKVEKYKQKLEKIKEIVTDEINLKFDITEKLKDIKLIIEGEK